MSSESGGSGGILREMLAIFSFGVDDKELEKGENRLGKFLGRVKEIGEAVLAAFAVEQIYEFAESQAQAMNAIERTGAQLGITTDRVQEFRFAAQSMGLQADDLLNSMGRLQVAQEHAGEGSKEQSQAFHALGISMSELKGKAVDELMLDVADGLAKVEDPAKRAAYSVALFGRQGRTLLPFLEKGREGAEEYFKTFREVGGGYTEEAIKAGKDFDEQQARTDLALTGLKNTIAKALLPVVTALARGTQSVVMWFNNLAKNSHLVEASLIAIGAAALSFIGPLIVAEAPLLLMAAAIAAVVLAIDDLYTFLSGGDSATGELLDKIFGKGTGAEAGIATINQYKLAWEQVKEVFHALVPLVDSVVNKFKWMNDHLGKFGGWIGDLAGKADFGEGGLKYDQEAKGAAQNRSGQSYEQNVARKQAERMIDAESAGQPFNLTEVPKGFEKNNFLEDVKIWANTLRQGAYVAPNTYGPVNQQPPTVNAPVTVNVTTPPGLNEKEVAHHVAKQVHEVIKQRNRDAIKTLPTAAT